MESKIFILAISINLATVGFLAVVPTASADCILSLSSECGGNCDVNAGTCDGECSINTAYCGDGARCEVNVSACYGDCDVNAGLCRTGSSCTVNLRVC